jgi:hypothetical protein
MASGLLGKSSCWRRQSSSCLSRDFWQRTRTGFPARTENAAKKEALAHDLNHDKEFWEARRKAGLPFNRDGHYDNWCSSTDELRRMGRRLAKLRAKTFEGISIKATVLAIAREAMEDDDDCCDDLQSSILNDIARNARAVA